MEFDSACVPAINQEEEGQEDALALATRAQTFFRQKLSGIETPSAPFEITTLGSHSAHAEHTCTLDPELAHGVLTLAHGRNLSIEAIVHCACALVVAATSAKTDMIFGTVPTLARNLARLGSADTTVHALPLRLCLQGLSVSALLARMSTELTELAHYAQTPPDLIRRCSDIPDPIPLFTAALRFTREMRPALVFAEVPVQIAVSQLGERFELRVASDPRIEPSRIASYLQQALQTLLDAMIRTPEQLALKLSILPAREWQQVIETFNGASVDFPAQETIHALFEARTRETPEAPAVECDDGMLTYAQLNRRANRLARHLLAQGLQLGECVPVQMTRSIAMVIAQLAVLKSGGAYMPLDPDFPEERRLSMLERCGARLIIADPLPAMSARGSLHWIHYTFPDEEEFRGLLEHDLQLPMLASSPAYVMFTSGSTGTPKGVVIPHRAVNNLVLNRYATITAEDRVAHCSNPGFDPSVFDLWAPLLNGGRVVVVPHAVLMNPETFAELLISKQVTAAVLTTGLFLQYMESLKGAFGGLRYLIIGGEVADPNVVTRLLREHPPQNFLNAYGPTECTVLATTYRFRAGEDLSGGAPIGAPIANVRIRILDRHLQPAPIGVFGDLYIGGAGLALGYLGRADLTAERFIADPFSHLGCERLYRTGDLGRWRPDGNIEFGGRSDRQVKVRGYRVEIREIELALASHPAVKQCLVLMLGDTVKDQRLVGYVAVSEGQKGRLQPRELRTHLMRTLPIYMVPVAFVILEHFPLDANGKVARKALPKPDLTSHTRAEYEAPQGHIEIFLAHLWQDLLRVERVGRNDDFFELGGYSLQGMRLISRLAQQLGAQHVNANVFQFPTVRRMAALIHRMMLSPDVRPMPSNTSFEEGVL